MMQLKVQLKVQLLIGLEMRQFGVYFEETCELTSKDSPIQWRNQVGTENWIGFTSTLVDGCKFELPKWQSKID